MRFPEFVVQLKSPVILSGTMYSSNCLINKQSFFYRVLNQEVKPSGFRPTASKAFDKKRAPLETEKIFKL